MSTIALPYSQIQDLIQCPICQKSLHDPRALPCQHIFCNLCIKSLRKRSTIICTICQTKFSGSQDYPISFLHKTLLDLKPINFDIHGRCLKCKQKCTLTFCQCCEYYLCDQCLNTDRINLLHNLRYLVQICTDRQSLIPDSIEDLLQTSRNILRHQTTLDLNDIVPIVHQLDTVYQQTNCLPITRVKRTKPNVD